MLPGDEKGVAMSGLSSGARARWIVGAAVVLAAGLPAAAAADPFCGLCARAVVTNSSLARCFLERYETFAGRGNGAIAIDLSDCETDRGIVAALPAPVQAEERPDTEFIVSRPQLLCLKRKLEEPGLTLDPALRIDLDRCG